ncbi:MAG: tRNA 2-thiouridine(34) synthase MnmA [Chloroflexota bacterium]
MTKVVVAMSGGVDSSVAAVILKQQGYDVVGMMLRLWSEPGKEDSNRCCTPDAVALARRVAARLDIPFYVVDAKEIFHSTVVNYFLEEYLQGATPNPCLICNRTIRWKFLLEHALAMGADYMATGHYVRLRSKLEQKSDREAEEKIQLLRAIDRSKDQSYVLHVLNQEQLGRALFPVGDFPKDKIRKMAEDEGLPTASRPDSQDLCFLAGEDYRKFIKRNAPESLKPGDIVKRDGRILGQHQGLSFYTIGQRKGLGLAFAQPHYVLAKQIETNRLIVGLEDELGQNELTVENVHWIAGKPPDSICRVEVKIRYSAREAWAEISQLEGGNIRVKFDQPQRDIAVGQSAVFFDGDVVLGGGRIVANDCV